MCTSSCNAEVHSLRSGG
nr:unnamed protein product [Callosobruchus analis]